MSDTASRRYRLPVTPTRGRWQLGSAIVVLSVTTAAARGIGLVASLVVAYLLGAHQLGVFALLTVAAAFLGAAGVLGFAPLCTRAVAAAADAEEARAVVAFVARTCARFLVVLGAVYLALALAKPELPGLLSAVRLPATGSLLECVLVPVWGLALGLSSVAQAAVAGHRAFAAVSVANLARASVVGALSIGAAAGWHTATATATGAVVGETLTLLGLGWLAWRRRWLARVDTDPSGRRAPLIGGRLVRRAMGSGIASLGTQLSGWVGQILVSHSHDGLVGSGVFLLASRLVLVVTLVPNALATSALPMLASTQPPDDRTRMRRRAIAIALGCAVPAAVVMVVGALLLLPLVDRNYLTYRSTVVLMGGVGIAMAANNLYSSLALADGRFRAWIVSDGVLAATLMGGAVVLVPRLGTPGLAATYLVAYAVSVAVLAHAIRGPRPKVRA